MTLKDLANDPAFSELPHFRECFVMLQQASDDFEADIQRAARLSHEEGLVAFANSLIRYCVRYLTAINIGRGRAEHSAARNARRLVKRTLIAHWPTRDISLAEHRAIAVSIAYRYEVRFSSSGEADTRMEAALQAAAVVTGFIGKDPIEALRKSITRLRAQWKDSKFLWLNRDLLEVEIACADAAIFGEIPGRPGRPRKPR